MKKFLIGLLIFTVLYYRFQDSIFSFYIRIKYCGGGAWESIGYDHIPVLNISYIRLNNEGKPAVTCRGENEFN